MTFRRLIVSLLACWLAFGPAASALAQTADRPCESMGMSMPANDCCGEGMDQAKCLTGCLAASPTVAATTAHVGPALTTSAVCALPSIPHASILAPPDIAPPKPFVS